MRKLFVFILMLSFFSPSLAKAEEEKSLGVVLGTVLAPIGVGVLGSIEDFQWGITRFAPFAVATIPMASHGYLGDYRTGLTFLLIKGAGFVIMHSAFRNGFVNDWDDPGTSECVIGGSIIAIAYLYEVVHLINRTEEINEALEKDLSVSFYPVVDTNSISLGVTLNF